MVHPLTRAQIENLFVEKYGALEYDDASHKYTLVDSGKELVSITKKKKEILGEEFNAPLVACEMATRTGRPAQQYLDEWKAVAEAGTMFHELMESILMHGEIQRPTDHSAYSKLAHDRFLSMRMRGLAKMTVGAIVSRRYVPVACELKVWCGDYAGTIDLLVWDIVDMVYRVLDFKTNAKSFAPTKWDNLLGAPFHKFKGGKIGEYSVQLESYAAMLEAIGLPMGDGLLLHAYWDAMDNYLDQWDTIGAMRPVVKKWRGL